MSETTSSEKGPEIPVLLFEIGTEEIPARFLPDALSQLKERAERLFGEYRLCYGTLKTCGTPRRLTLIAEIDRSQTAAEREAWGPPVKVAFDASGAPTKAALAFAEAQGIPVGELQQREKGKGTYLVAFVKEAAGLTADVMPELLAKLIQGLTFPKTMRWGDGTLRFARPVHWILALYDNQRISFEIEGIRSGASTRGHRFLSPASFEVKDARTYANLLKTNFVVVDFAERRKTIQDGAKKLADSANAFVVPDDELLDHVTNLVEYPSPVMASFSKEYLTLPKELLITVMKGHQKYFALEDDMGALTNHFVVVSNTRGENAETVRKGAEKVIKARFEDARFYYETDIKTTIAERQEKLKQVVFHEKLGSVYDKARRVSSIAKSIAEKCCPTRKGEAESAGLICKNDLVSGVVFEFPELQGVMGSYYAAKEGRREGVALALREQYFPRFSGDSLPSSDCGAIVSLSDKLDNIVSFFMLGLAPSGTEDPFALRRQAIGATLILLDKRYAVTVRELLEGAALTHKPKAGEDLVDNVLRFFEQRFDQIFQSLGYSRDVIEATAPLASTLPLHLLKDRMDALKKLKEEAGYEGFLLMIKRVSNIAPKGDAAAVNPDLFVQPEERSLHEAVVASSQALIDALAANQPSSAIEKLTALSEPVSRFFDKVLIMDKDEAVKQNRLALVKSIQGLASLIADFSKLS